MDWNLTRMQPAPENDALNLTQIQNSLTGSPCCMNGVEDPWMPRWLDLDGALGYPCGRVGVVALIPSMSIALGLDPKSFQIAGLESFT
jgi:hypothetical protein